MIAEVMLLFNDGLCNIIRIQAMERHSPKFCHKLGLLASMHRGHDLLSVILDTQRGKNRGC